MTADGLDAIMQAKRDGRRFGVAINSEFTGQEAYDNFIKTESGIVTPENELKFESVYTYDATSGGTYDFTNASAIVTKAQALSQKIRGHALVWHSQLPANLPKEGCIDLMNNHIDRMLGEFKNDIAEWDVVNEVFSDSSDGGYRTESFWYECSGTDFVAQAFYRAKATSDNLGISPVLYYNDYSIEQKGQTKADFAYKEIEKLVRQGVPIQGVGFQSHYLSEPNYDNIRDNIKRYTDLGLKVSFTEVDVVHKAKDDPEFPASQAEIYKKLALAFVESANTVNFMTWGVHDPSSWIPDDFTDKSKLPPNAGNPLLLNNAFEKKLAYFEVKGVIQGPAE